MFVVNILLPGVGTLVAGIKSERNTTMVIGVLQFLLAFLIVGWIWSIYWGWLIYKKVLTDTLSPLTPAPAAWLDSVSLCVAHSC